MTTGHRLRLALAAGVGLLSIFWLVWSGLSGATLSGTADRRVTDPVPTTTGLPRLAPAVAAPSTGTRPTVAPPTAAVPSTPVTASPAADPAALDPVAADPVDPAAAAPVPGAAPLSADATGAVPADGPGTFVVAPGGTAVVGTGPISLRYTVEVEDGLPLDTVAVAGRVDGILGDPRSWIGSGRWQLQRVADPATVPDARILLATPATTDRLCLPLQTAGRYSCRNGNLVILNAVRWADGAESWGSDVDGYRGYLVNHEFGHYLGFGHTPCPAPDAPAPVMLQQTKGLAGCSANAWPAVTGG